MKLSAAQRRHSTDPRRSTPLSPDRAERQSPIAPGTLHLMRRLLVSVALVSVACAPTLSVESFCDEAVPILSRDDLGDDPAAMQRQMDDLSIAAEHLTPDQSAELRAQIDAINTELDLAVQGQAENGWSNAAVVDVVGSLCGDDDLIVWIVQP